MNRRDFIAGACASVASTAATGQLRLESGSHHGVALVNCSDGSRQLRLAQDNSGNFQKKGEFLSDEVPSKGPVRISWTPQWITPQRYRKSPKNPIYGPGQSGSWDKWTNGVGILRTADGKGYHM